MMQLPQQRTPLYIFAIFRERSAAYFTQKMRSNKCPACPSKKEPARDKTSLTCRVQYLNDIDPFAYTTSFPDPPRPPLHTFSVTLPLINQLAAVHRLLNAPHRVSRLLYHSDINHCNPPPSLQHVAGRIPLCLLCSLGRDYSEGGCVRRRRIVQARCAVWHQTYFCLSLFYGVWIAVGRELRLNS